MAPRKDSNGGVIGHESQRQRISIALPKDINRAAKGYQSQDKNFKCRKKKHPLLDGNGCSELYLWCDNKM